MPPLETTDLHDDAVLWTATGRVDAFGRYEVTDEAVDLKCRWVDGQREALTPQGEPLALDATVVVDRDVPVGSIMAKGTLADWGLVGTGDVGETGTLMQVKTADQARDLKNRFTRRTVGLMIYRGSLPTITTG